LQVRGVLRAAKGHHQRGEIRAWADRETLQKLEVTGGVQLLDGIRWDRSLPADGGVAGVFEGVPIRGGLDPAALPQAGERIGPGTTAQVVRRDDATARAAGGGAQQLGLGRGELGQGFHGGSGLIEDAAIHALDDQEAKKKMMSRASRAHLVPFNLINYCLYDLHRLYAARNTFAGAWP
jgi:hypothetical protein